MPITPKGSEGSVMFGLSNVYIASVTESRDADTGEITTTYGDPKAWPGAVHMTLNTKATSTDSYADNGVWYTTNTNPGYDGSYESMHVPEWAATDLLGRVADDNGAILECSEDRPKYFALMFETQTDTYPTRYVYYKCILSNPSGDWETTSDSTTPKTATANIRVMPRADVTEINGMNMHAIGAVVSATTDATAYDDFYEAVYEPTFTPPSP